MNSGQCFRISEVSNGVFFILTKDKFLRVDVIGKDKFLFYCDESQFKYYIDYFDLNYNYEKIKKACIRSDIFLKNAMKATDGLRILKQDKFETIISFIISQRKSIKAIQTSIERLSKICGKKIKNKFGTFYAFPTAIDLASLSMKELRSCGLGYRAEYIKTFCKEYLVKKINLDSFEKFDDQSLLDKFMEYKGIGIKVASCIALFAYHRFSICPVDVWISRVLKKFYRGKIPLEYREFAGVIQQYWFNFAKNYDII